MIEEVLISPPSLYFARSSHGEGWGVFASRNFAKGEIVEMAPMFLRFPDPDTEGPGGGGSSSSGSGNRSHSDVHHTPVLHLIHSVLRHWFVARRGQ